MMVSDAACANARRSRQVLSLPLFPEMSQEQQERVVDELHLAIE